MIKYVSFLIFSTVLFINTNVFSMDKGTILNELGEDPHIKIYSQLTPSDRGILGAWVNKDMEAPSGQSTAAEEETASKKKTSSRVLVKKSDTKLKDPNEEDALLEASLGREYTLDPMLDNEVPLLTKPQFVALIFFKFFIQAPIEIIDNSVKTTVCLSIDSANNIWNFMELIHFLYDPDSALDEFYPIEK